MADQYTGNQDPRQIPGSPYGFPQYPGGVYAANQMSNLGYHPTHPAVIGAQNEAVLAGYQAMTGMIPPLHPGAPGLRPRIDPTQDLQLAGGSGLRGTKKGKKKPKKKVPKKKPKKKKPAKKKPAKKAEKAKPKITKSGRKKRERDPAAPKRARTAFNYFLDDFRAQFKIDHPETKGIVEVTKAGSAAWKALDREKRDVYESKAKESQRKYAEAKQAYIESGGPTKFKYVNGPHRPPTAYFIFLHNFRKDYFAAHSGMKIVSELSKEAGLKWRNLTPEERKFFEEKGKAVKEEYYKIKAMTTEERIAYLEIDKDPYAKFF